VRRPSASRTIAPTNTQSQWSLPDEKPHRPVSSKPPGTMRAVPAGLYDELIHASGLSPHTSFCARSGYRPRCHEWTPTTPVTQPAELDSRAISCIAALKTPGSDSKPP